ncbi:hypothetical protein HMPREF0733_12201 [Rothia dentocariosa ATCC 17931]|uniref:Uncharacterized protein n=1 Tax=Rothia dentocariosa (strain ATCC 17931 / CDC X599 / XDIA) TaxID=762948 RepID=E3H418_ROTDC|nr:hypothetical protein HMPREF0733_12201 [Rothia dentocariosa ATCC 17931]
MNRMCALRNTIAEGIFIAKGARPEPTASETVRKIPEQTGFTRICRELENNTNEASLL